jgi:hypothetical protein
MYYCYSRPIRVLRLSRGMRTALEIGIAVTSALLMGYLIVRGTF